MHGYGTYKVHVNMLMDLPSWLQLQDPLNHCFPNRFACGPLLVLKNNHGIARSKRDGTCTETRFGLSAKRMSPFKSAGVSVRSTTGSWGVRLLGQRLYRPCSDVQCKAAGYPLHSHLSPSLPLPCVTVCHQAPNALYLTSLLMHYIVSTW